ncbi:tryptophan transporter [Bacillus sp. FJAT-42376]|uniref:tryptophan transporter n=1 Tax=Bacillus sp. FJAT-42376 TaxID=2014076 RepID=UPI000F50DDE5|nr:tryptophan transporter [Bacillus sp. FJAT-42376]AZB42241.1 tryptophan transporter [Bacillus sp. FJAT-42376]
MKTKELVTMSLFVAIGLALHSIIPPIFLGMKPDMMLTMMFLGIALFPNLKNTLLLGVLTGILSALTTGFPGGQLPNIIDKPVTALVFFLLITLAGKLAAKPVTVASLTAVGTIISGVIFLGSALLIVGLPGGFTALFLTVVLPAAALNTVAITLIYPIVTSIQKRSKPASAA